MDAIDEDYNFNLYSIILFLIELKFKNIISGFINKLGPLIIKVNRNIL